MASRPEPTKEEIEDHNNAIRDRNNAIRNFFLNAQQTKRFSHDQYGDGEETTAALFKFDSNSIQAALRDLRSDDGEAPKNNFKEKQAFWGAMGIASQYSKNTLTRAQRALLANYH